MGYTIDIGQAVLEHDEEAVWIDVEPKRLEEAPAFGEPTDYTNSRWPSYTAWSRFCSATDLNELFYVEYDGLFSSHPGVKLLTKEHKQVIDEAYEKYKKKHPEAVPGDWKETDAEGWFGRLTWLKFWVDWALENCTVPVIRNS